MKDWDLAFFVSRQEQKAHLKGRGANVWLNISAKQGKTASAHFVAPAGLPPEFADWEGARVDLRLETYPYPAYAERIATSLSCGGAVALKKNGLWYALRLVGDDPSSLTPIFQRISEARAQELLHFPPDYYPQVTAGT